MSSNGYLLAAYIATWVIHIGYILHLGSSAKRVERDLKELESSTQRPADRSR
jgi:CcmD family protein